MLFDEIKKAYKEKSVVGVTTSSGDIYTGVIDCFSPNHVIIMIDNAIKTVVDINIIDIVEFRVITDNNYESKDVMVSHPSHYKSETGLEVIDVVEAFTSELKGIEATDTGNVIKYICRWKQKNGLQDLEKAMWYLQHLKNHVEKEND